MEYQGYKVTEEKDRVIVENVRDFNPKHILECGQCFRWIRQEDGSYTGVVRDKVANLKYDQGTLVIKNSDLRDFIHIWYGYLDLGRDYSRIKEMLCKDEIMERAVKFGHGMRILNQDLWETLVSFILSSNNHIPRIMKIVGTIAREYGKELEYKGRIYHTFPEAQEISGADLERLEVCRGGYRCKYIYLSSLAVSQGQISLENIRRLDTDTARQELTKFPGVGPKVADCILLYSGTKQDVFPTDVWVKRVMEELYFKREASMKEIQKFAAEYFGELAGFAQQYLFYYARENKIGTK